MNGLAKRFNFIMKIDLARKIVSVVVNRKQFDKMILKIS